MEKKKKILSISGLVLLLVVLVAGAVAAYSGLFNREPVAEEIPSVLYWNVDREQHIPKLGGDTTRRPDSDGLWTVRFLTEGELVEYRVADKNTMIEIDRLSALGLEVDEKGIVTQIIDIRDMGYREVANKFYVQQSNKKNIEVSSAITGDAININLKCSEETEIWNVSDLAETPGMKDDLMLMDCVTAYKNEDGAISDIFIVDREELLLGVSTERYCEHCQKVVTWRMWLADNTLPVVSGHFRMIKDIKLKGQYSMQKDLDIVLDLNGKTIFRDTGRPISLHNENVTLSLMDGSEEKTGAIKGTGEYMANGGLVSVYYGTFNFYSGTLDASEVIDAGGNGAAVTVAADTTFNMYGGTIKGGTSKVKMLKYEGFDTEYPSGGMGGNVYCVGTMNMYGGEIRDGKVEACYSKDGKIQNIFGGNIAILKTGVVNIYGGKITGGQVVNDSGQGGNINVKGADSVLNIYGGTIENGVSMGFGGNISSSGTVNMSGGTVKGGKSVKGKSIKTAVFNEAVSAHNVILYSSKFHMSGGTIDGYVTGLSSNKDKEGNMIPCDVKFSGTARVWGGKKNVTMGSQMIDFGKLSGNAKIGVNGTGFISNKTIASNAKYVHWDYEGADTVYFQNRLFIGKTSCLCGGYLNSVDGSASHDGEHAFWCDGEVIGWKPWQTTNATLPATSGSYYLLGDMELTERTAVVSGVTVELDLNGHKVTKMASEDPTSAANRVLHLSNAKAHYAITDTSREQTGIICFAEDFASGCDGELFQVGIGTLDIYRGQYDMTNIGKGNVGAKGTKGQPINITYSVAAGAEKTRMNIYGGTFKAVANKVKDSYSNCIYLRSSLSVYGGSIEGQVLIPKSADTDLGSLTISGTAKIGLSLENASAQAHGIEAWGKVTIPCDDVTADAKVVFKSGDNIVANLTDSEVSAFDFVEDRDGHYGVVEKSNGKLAFATSVCVCGADISKDSKHSCPWLVKEKKTVKDIYAMTWKPWDGSNTTLPNASGYYYLTGDMDLTGRASLATARAVHLDLNGYTATKQTAADPASPENRVLHLSKENAKYTISDSKGNGTIRFAEDFSSGCDGELFQVGIGTLDIYGGLFDMSNIGQGNAGTKGTNGQPINITYGTDPSKTCMNIYGGTFKGATAKAKATNSNCIYLRSSLSIYGGIIEGQVLIPKAAAKDLASLTINGSPKVGLPLANASEQEHGIEAWGKVTVPCEDVTADANIVFKSGDHIVVNLKDSEVSAFDFVEDRDGHYGIVNKSDGSLAFATTVCVCGANVSDNPKHTCPWLTKGNKTIEHVYTLAWRPWDATNTSLPKAAGCYYLAGDMELTSTAKVEETNSVHLDLNGHTATKKTSVSGATSTDNRTLQLYFNDFDAEYTISDSKKNGTICFADDFVSGTSGEFAHVTSGMLDIYGGTIDMTNIGQGNGTKGVTTQNSGPINLTYGGNSATSKDAGMNVYGGTIKGAKNISTASSNCIMLNSVLGVYGGTIEGQVVMRMNANDYGKLTVGGVAKVAVPLTSDSTQPYGIEAWKWGAKLVCDGVKSDAQIVVKSTGNIAIEAESNTPASVFEVVGDRYGVVKKSDGKLDLVSAICVCGANVVDNPEHTCSWLKKENKKIADVYELNWQPWDNTNTSLPTTAGYYYLTGDMTLTSTAKVEETSSVHLDLNGYTVTKDESTSGSNRTLQLYFKDFDAEYTIADSKGNGSICFTDDFVSNTSGEFAHVTSGWLTIYGGTIDMTNIGQGNATKGVTSNGSGPLNLTYGGNSATSAQAGMSVYGGTIKGAKNINGASSNCIMLNSVLYIYGGTIEGQVVMRMNANDYGKLTVGGSAKVAVPLTIDPTQVYGIEAWKSGAKLVCDGVKSDAQIIVKSTSNIAIELESETPATAFKVYGGRYGYVKNSGKLDMVSAICVCGANVIDNHEHTCSWLKKENKKVADVYELNWQPWDATNASLPTTTGYYYLTEDIELTSTAKVQETSSVHLDLNGYTATKKTSTLGATNADNRTLQLYFADHGAEYTIADSKENGTICFAENFVSGAAGEFAHVTSGWLTIYGGTIDMTNIGQGNDGTKGVKSDGPINLTYGGNGATSAQAGMNIYGGTIKGAKNINGAQTNCIMVKSSLSVYGGTIEGRILLHKDSAAALGKLTLNGTPKIGLPLGSDSTQAHGIWSWVGEATVECKDVKAGAEIVFNSGANISLSGTGTPTVFRFLTGEHEVVIDTDTNKLKLQVKN